MVEEQVRSRGRKWRGKGMHNSRMVSLYKSVLKQQVLFPTAEGCPSLVDKGMEGAPFGGTPYTLYSSHVSRSFSPLREAPGIYVNALMTSWREESFFPFHFVRREEVESPCSHCTILPQLQPTSSSAGIESPPYRGSGRERIEWKEFQREEERDSSGMESTKESCP
jgi:hypothetical protein